MRLPKTTTSLATIVTALLCAGFWVALGFVPETSSATAPYAVASGTSQIEFAAAAVAPVSGESSVEAEQLLQQYQERFVHLDNVTVSEGLTPDGHQAVAYFREGRIVISPDRIASAEQIMAHEVWHIIDWRDNGRIDWDEDVPPANWEVYLRDDG